MDLFAYRYAALPFDLAISVEKLLPQIEVEELVETYLEPNQITTNLLAMLNIQRAGVFQIDAGSARGLRDSHRARPRCRRRGGGGGRFASPGGSRVRARPDDAGGEGEEEDEAGRELGPQGDGQAWPCGSSCRSGRRTPNLLQPTGTMSVLNLPVPRVHPASVARTAGRMLVYAPESLRIKPKELKGLRPISAGRGPGEHGIDPRRPLRRRSLSSSPMPTRRSRRA